MSTSSPDRLISVDSLRSQQPMNGQQLTLELEPGLLERYSSVREVVAAGVYQRGLQRTAEKLFIPPGNLSVQLSGDGQRKFGVDDLEAYMDSTGDKTPALYLAAKYLNDRAAESEASDRQMAETLRALLAQVEGKRGRK